MKQGYSGPATALLDYGKGEDRHFGEPWQDYLALGLTEADVPELVRMVEDRNFDRLPASDNRVWAPLHAWRVLALLNAAEVVEPLLRRLAESPDDDWLTGDIAQVFAMLGPSVLPNIERFMADEAIDEMVRICMPESLREIARDHPEVDGACGDMMVRQLMLHERNRPVLNAFLIMCLCDLGRGDAIDLIREAYASDHVDLTVFGDLEDAELQLGLRTKRDTPRKKLPHLANLAKILSGREESSTRIDQAINSRRHVGRNDPCPCGSGKKYKKCCLMR